MRTIQPKILKIPGAKLSGKKTSGKKFAKIWVYLTTFPLFGSFGNAVSFTFSLNGKRPESSSL